VDACQAIGVESVELVAGQVQVVRPEVLLEMTDRRRAGNGDHGRRPLQQPRECNLSGRCPMRDGDATESAASPSKRAASEAHPRQKRQPVALACFEHALPGSIGQAVAVLNGDDRGRRASPRQLLAVDVAQTDVLNLALRLELGQRPDRVLERYLRIDGVQLVEVDPVRVGVA
jgi:hypothetical protein